MASPVVVTAIANLDSVIVGSAPDGAYLQFTGSVAGYGTLTLADEPVPLRRVGTLSVQAQTGRDCCGVAYTAIPTLDLGANTLELPASAEIAVAGGKLVARGAHLTGVDGADAHSTATLTDVVLDGVAGTAVRWNADVDASLTLTGGEVHADTTCVASCGANAAVSGSTVLDCPTPTAVDSCGP